LELLQPRARVPLSAASETALIRLLAALGDPRSQAILWSRIVPERPPEVRTAALQALGMLGLPKEKDKIRLLLTCATDPDFRVAAPALMFLRALPQDRRSAGQLLPLLDAPDPAARRFAMAGLAGVDTPQVADSFLRQLQHPDAGLRAEAVEHLGEMKRGREALARALLDAPGLEDAWHLARAQAPFVRDYSPALRERLFARASALLESDDRRADAYLFLLREVDARAVRDRLAERALALRKKKAF